MPRPNFSSQQRKNNIFPSIFSHLLNFFFHFYILKKKNFSSIFTQTNKQNFHIKYTHIHIYAYHMKHTQHRVKKKKKEEKIFHLWELFFMFESESKSSNESSTFYFILFFGASHFHILCYVCAMHTITHIYSTFMFLFCLLLFTYTAHSA